MECVRDGNEWIFTWPDGDGSLAKIVVGANNIHESGKDTYCEVSVGWCSNTDTFFGPADMNLKSPRSQADTITRLTARTKGEIDKELWASLIEQVCHKVLLDYRAGEPFVLLADVGEVGPVKYCIEQFLPQDETTAIACAGGRGKGWVAVNTCLSYAMAFPFVDQYEVHSDGRPAVLYLDWEENANETARRFQWLAKGMGLTTLPRNIIYRRMTRPLVEQINYVRAEAVRNQVGLVIIDSLAPASGGEIKDERMATRTMEAIRELSPATRFVIGHVSKADAKNENSHVTIIGSGLYEYLARSYWEMQSEHYGSSVSIALLHKKINTGPKLANIALELRWDDINHMAMLTTGKIEDVPVALDHSDLATRMVEALRRGAKSPEALAKELDVKENVIRATASKTGRIINLNAHLHGSGARANYALRAEREQLELG